MISVVIPLYNKENSITRALTCVLDQTCQEFEVIVVDDGSTDNGATKVEQFPDPRIRIISQPNGGVSVARNTGINEAKSEYIAFLDADDEWLPTHLETLHEIIEKYPDCKAYSTGYEFRQCGKTKKTIIKKLPFNEKDGVLTNYFEVASCSHPPVCSITVCIQKSLLEEIGGFPTGIKSGEDLLTWARIATKTNWGYSTKKTAIYDLGNESASTPRRKHDKYDPVGDQLIKLYHENPSFIGLKKYVARWFKMRSMCFLQEGKIPLVWKNAIKSLRYNFREIKVYVFLLISLFPTKIRNRILKNCTR